MKMISQPTWEMEIQEGILVRIQETEQKNGHEKAVRKGMSSEVASDIEDYALPGQADIHPQPAFAVATQQPELESHWNRLPTAPSSNGDVSFCILHSAFITCTILRSWRSVVSSRSSDLFPKAVPPWL
jgi:hypothetical protein